MDYEVFVTPATHIPSWEGVVDRCNLLVERCLEEGWDYLWLVQGDVEVPENAFQKLHSLNVDVALGFCPYHHDYNSIIAGFMDENKKIWYLPRNVIKGKILSGWVFAGLSCTLIKRQVFESGIRFKYHPWSGCGEDVLFMWDTQRAGFIAKVHGDAECGHLPEWPLARRQKTEVLDVGCGHEPKGDVNVDLFMKATPHRSPDQRVCDDKPLDVKAFPNFVCADACYLPFQDEVFSRAFSSHTIEHVGDPEKMLNELVRVSKHSVEVICPHAESPWASGPLKPLHIHVFKSEWFQNVLSQIPNIDFDLRFKMFGDRPGDIIVKMVKRESVTGLE
ncbi:MAG: class I SAM-dependent methyltransferase [Candidatus Bathyarchaeia archaeon]